MSLLRDTIGHSPVHTTTRHAVLTAAIATTTLLIGSAPLKATVSSQSYRLRTGTQGSGGLSVSPGSPLLPRVQLWMVVGEPMTGPMSSSSYRAAFGQCTCHD